MVIYKVFIPVKSIFHNPGMSWRPSKFKVKDSFPYYFNAISNIYVSFLLENNKSLYII